MTALRVRARYLSSDAEHANYICIHVIWNSSLAPTFSLLPSYRRDTPRGGRPAVMAVCFGAQRGDTELECCTAATLIVGSNVVGEYLSENDGRLRGVMGACARPRLEPVSFQAISLLPATIDSARLVRPSGPCARFLFYRPGVLLVLLSLPLGLRIRDELGQPLSTQGEQEVSCSDTTYTTLSFPSIFLFPGCGRNQRERAPSHPTDDRGRRSQTPLPTRGLGFLAPRAMVSP